MQFKNFCLSNRGVLMRRALLILSCLAISSLAAAITIYVPSEYPTIQAGIAASSDGDTVLVSTGTYVENIDFLGKEIVVKSASGPETTIIDGNQAGSVVTFDSGEDEDSILEGFTLTNGHGAGGFWDYTGGGITCKNSSDPTITNNTITMNSAETAGGGIACLDYSDPTITNNTITGNTASQGGGIYGLHSFLTIENNTITGNSASSYGGGIYGYYVGATVTNNVISGNSAGTKGGGMAVLEATHTSYPIWEIRNNIIADNWAGTGGGGINIQCSFPDGHNIINNTITGNRAESGGAIALSLSAYPVITNSILWDNSDPVIYISAGGGEPTVSYSDITGGWPGTGNIDLDPEFIYPDQSDYRLNWGSPCIDSGDPASPPDPDGTICDMGSICYDQSIPLCVLLTPFDSPIQIPSAGGSFDYYIQVTNIDQSALNVEVWCDVTLPDGSSYGPVLGPVNINAGSGITIGRERNQSVPAAAPAGVYTYNAYAVAGTDTSFDSFSFVKLEPGGWDGAAEWFNTGESFEELVTNQVTMPTVYSLEQNYPNPFNNQTVVSYSIPTSSLVRLTVYDITGREVESLVTGQMSRGYHEVVWDAKNMGSGVYFVRMEAGDFVQTRKIVLTK